MTPLRMRRLANALTVSRVPLAVAVVVAVALEHPLVAAALVAAAAVTDALDGRVARAARRRGDTSTAGDWLDPLADKLFVATVAIAIGARTGAWLAVALIGAREFALAAVALFARRWRGRVVLRAAALGKAATVAQLVALGVLVAAPEYALPFAAVAGALGLAAVFDYVRRARASPA